ncbi:hypothetical protein brsh051_27990 [Brooklawnia propionicigenes]|uniref:ATP/GTP-binding protein n=1 Tax=Brooklawnia propionicigenes TaxID=3041175 RepID=A0AAN0KHM0_9ACTN|nr:hypothetical protein [Brooklawnia sp. SH051]MEA5121457.1 hypothetical protein [Propionibacterium sp.]BEH03518.1 hypothetical protein brsh051_27990 [Brooklawnia sp. SH051]
MAKRRSKHTRAPRPLRLDTFNTSASKADGLWVTRQIRAENATKTYSCPECGNPIPPGTPHIVAWPHTPPIGSTSGVDYRRHFHSYCWERRR